MRVRSVVNGDSWELDLEPRTTLADALREERGLTSVHLGCGDGTCGACTVLVDGEATRSCLMLAVQCQGASLRTIEGLAVDHALPVAQGAARCGPGLVMLAAGAVAREPELAGDPGRLHALLAANVCRCADHDAIQRAVARAAATARPVRRGPR